MKILITGAAGAIGSNLAERLLLEGHQVIGIDALTPYYDPRLKKATAELLESKGVIFYYENLITANLESILRDCQVIFHLAAQPGISAGTSFEEYLNNNFIATHQLLEA